jgi:hypothetical protein
LAEAKEKRINGSKEFYIASADITTNIAIGTLQQKHSTRSGVE